MKHESRAPRVLQRLYGEHRYISALIRVLEEKTRPRVRLKTGDYYLLRDIVGYVHDYPGHVHHPTEDLLFERVLLKDPTLQEIVERLRLDHRDLQAETQQLLGRFDDLLDAGPGEARARGVPEACRSLARHQRAHMDLENREAFPAANAVLSGADWEEIETCFLTAEDPLFGKTVRGRHRLLYEYLLDFTEGGDREGIITALFSVDRLVQAGDVIVKGAEDGWNRLADLRDALATDSRSACRRPQRPAATVLIPAKLLFGVGRSMADCSADLLKIWAATARDTLAVYVSRGTA
jgi:hemerythrin-like domain-containing protein